MESTIAATAAAGTASASMDTTPFLILLIVLIPIVILTFVLAKRRKVNEDDNQGNASYGNHVKMRTPEERAQRKAEKKAMRASEEMENEESAVKSYKMYGRGAQSGKDVAEPSTNIENSANTSAQPNGTSTPAKEARSFKQYGREAQKTTKTE